MWFKPTSIATYFWNALSGLAAGITRAVNYVFGRSSNSETAPPAPASKTPDPSTHGVPMTYANLFRATTYLSKASDTKSIRLRSTKGERKEFSDIFAAVAEQMPTDPKEKPVRSRRFRC